MLVNGSPGNLISIRDRGLLYGDGVFRTLRVANGAPLHWPLHYQKLLRDCAALGIACPDFSCLSAELDGLLQHHPDAVFKLIVTRGSGARGYAPDSCVAPTHLWDVAPVPVYPEHWAVYGVALHLCALSLGHQPRLAGIKHLNRLENVLAAAEFAGSDAAEGLLLDDRGRVIEGTRSNIFLISNNRLITPDLSRCGVAGVARDRVMAAAGKTGMPVEVREVALDELSAADEVFLTNSVFGLWPVARFEQKCWGSFDGVAKLRTALDVE
ncbi:MAG: aminodeoxychorismate lyase [Gallionella sp.]|nr:aminodeoxychorismate lyase [Gallionella sp.]